MISPEVLRTVTAISPRSPRDMVPMSELSWQRAGSAHRNRQASAASKCWAQRNNPAAAGFPLQVFVTATLARHDPRSTRIFEDQVRALPQIVAADNVAGEMDYLLTVVARDVTDLQQVLASLAVRGGQRLVTHLKLAEVKPPTRLPLAETSKSAWRPVRQRRRVPGR